MSSWQPTTSTIMTLSGTNALPPSDAWLIDSLHAQEYITHSGLLGSGSSSASFEMPSGFADHFVAVVRAQLGTKTSCIRERVPVASALTIDTATLLTPPSSVAISIPEAGRPRATWSIPASVISVTSGAMLSARWQTTNTTWNWTAVFPPNTTVQAPPLPVARSEFAVPISAPFARGSLNFIATNVATSYAELILNAYELIDDTAPNPCYPLYLGRFYPQGDFVERLAISTF